MKKIWLNDTEYLVPQSWAECTPEQVSNGLTLSLYIQDSKQKEKLAHYWVGLTKVMLADVPNEIFYQLTGEQIFELRPLVKWAVTERISKKPFEYFEHEGVKYYLPAENFADTNCIELAMASIFYLAYTRKENADPDAVFNLVATLCRPERADLDAFKLSRDWNGDVREEYNSTLIESRSLKGLSMGTVAAVLQYYEFMQEQFSKRYDENYGEDESESPALFANGEGIIAMLEEVAETGTHGNFKDVCETNAHTIFMYLRHKLIINRAREKAQADAQDD